MFSEMWVEEQYWEVVVGNEVIDSGYECVVVVGAQCERPAVPFVRDPDDIEW